MPTPCSLRLRPVAILCAVIPLLGCESQKSAGPAKSSAEKTTVAQSAPPALPAPAKAAFRGQAGRSAPFTDSAGTAWLSDQGFAGGGTVERDPNTVTADTKDPALFLTEHYA